MVKPWLIPSLKLSSYIDYEGEFHSYLWGVRYRILQRGTGFARENLAHWLFNSKQICLTVPLEYNYRLIFVLIWALFVLYEMQLDNSLFYFVYYFYTFYFQFFTHPVVHSEMTRKWRGRFLMKKDLGKWTWFFLHIWCLFDMVLAPITFYIVSCLEMHSLLAGK